MDLSSIKPKEFYGKYLKMTHLSGDEYRALCPFHKDEKTANLSVNIAKGVYRCFACGTDGNMVTFYKQHTGKSAYDFAVEYKILNIDKQEIDDCIQALKRNKEELYYLKSKRGYSDETITKFKLGWNGYRVTIPIPDEHGVIINIRKISRDKKEIDAGRKAISHTTGRGKDKVGYGANALYGIKDIIDNEKCIICAGEWDRIMLKQQGFNACTSTVGEGTWKEAWGKFIRDKEIYIIFDCDKAGKNGAIRVADFLFETNKVKIIDLKLEEKEDISDWFVKYNKTPGELQELIDKTEWYTKKTKEYESTILSEASKAKYYNKDIMFKAMIMGKGYEPFQVMQSLELQCDKHGKEKKCGLCSLSKEGYKKVELKDRETILELIDINKAQLVGVIRRNLTIPKCGDYYIIKEEKRNIEEIHLIPEIEFIDFENREDEYVTRRAYYLGDGIKTNRIYTFYGTTLPDPKNQQVVHLVEKAVPAAGNIEKFKLNPDIKKQLQKFQIGDKTIGEKLEGMYEDLTYNVTKIYHRNDLLLALDLVFHSVLNFKFLDEKSEKGWLELFVLGDPGTGKSRTIERLIRHYRAGERISGENASRTGLVYSLQESGSKKWILRWGKIPLNDRRLVAIDQAEKLTKENYSELTDMRSSGIAIVTRVQMQTTNARTRLIFIANPPRRLVEYSYGIYGFKEIVGQNQDIRRFDFAMAIPDLDVSMSEINKRHTKKVPHVFNSEVCHNSIMFAWSRKINDIVFKKEAEDRILEIAKEFAITFNSTIPLVLGAEIRMKLARLSAALACLLYSTDESGEKVVIYKDHVEFVRLTLLRMYIKPGFDYYAYSQQREKEGKLGDEEYVREIINNDIGLIELLLDNSRYTKTDFETFFDFDKAGIKEMVNRLFKMRALKRYGTSTYVKTRAFIEFLKRYKKELETIKEDTI